MRIGMFNLKKIFHTNKKKLSQQKEKAFIMAKSLLFAEKKVIMLSVPVSIETCYQ